MKSVLIIGMGRFGRHMAQKLYDLGHDVLAIDKNEEKIFAIAILFRYPSLMIYFDPIKSIKSCVEKPKKIKILISARDILNSCVNLTKRSGNKFIIIACVIYPIHEAKMVAL